MSIKIIYSEDEIHEIPINIRYLYIRYIPENNVLPDLSKFVELHFLECEQCHLTSLENLPSSLQQLHCSNNQLTSLEHLPANLHELDCRNNNIVTLQIPDALRILYCQGNQIDVLTIPPLVEKVMCENNKITQIHFIGEEENPTLHELNCDTNELTTLDNLPKNLKILSCANNKLTYLQLPPHILELSCSNNNLGSLEVPETLRFLQCFDNNELTSIGKLPNTLQSLQCYNTPIYDEIYGEYNLKLDFMPIAKYNKIYDKMHPFGIGLKGGMRREKQRKRKRTQRKRTQK